MQSVEDVLDSFSGMITMAQASAIASGVAPLSHPEGSTSVQGLLEFIKAVRSAKSSEDATKVYTVSIEDTLYRIFNELEGASRRTVTLGRVGSTINVILSGALSSAVDERGFERGDLMLVRGASLDIVNERLVGTRGTTLSRARRSNLGITDFSKLKDGDKNIDIVGKVVEIGRLRQVSRLGIAESIAVADCRLSDTSDYIDVTLWGSSAMLTERMRVNDFIKIEFCSVRSTGSKLQVNANELSRVLVNKELASRFIA